MFEEGKSFLSCFIAPGIIRKMHHLLSWVTCNAHRLGWFQVFVFFIYLSSLVDYFPSLSSLNVIIICSATLVAADNILTSVMCSPKCFFHLSICSLHIVRMFPSRTPQFLAHVHRVQYSFPIFGRKNPSFPNEYIEPPQQQCIQVRHPKDVIFLPLQVAFYLFPSSSRVQRLHRIPNDHSLT